MLDKKDLRGAAALFKDLSLLLIEWADDLDRAVKKKGRKAAIDDVLVPGPAVRPVVAEAASDSVAEVAPGPVSASVPAPVAAAPGQRPVPPYTYDAVLSYVGTKISQGFKPQIVALFNSYGAKKFSEVDPSYYGDLVEAVAGFEAGDDHA